MKTVLSNLSAGTPITIKCVGNSMLPIVKPGDLKTIIPYDGTRELKLHDVVLARIGTNMLTHQIEHIDGDKYTIANARGKIDGIITCDAIYGVVVFDQEAKLYSERAVFIDSPI